MAVKVALTKDKKEPRGHAGIPTSDESYQALLEQIRANGLDDHLLEVGFSLNPANVVRIGCEMAALALEAGVQYGFVEEGQSKVFRLIGLPNQKKGKKDKTEPQAPNSAPQG